MKLVYVAEGAEARFRQVLETLEGSRPSGAKAVVWDATRALRAHLPGLQTALARPPQFGGGSYLDAQTVSDAVEEGFRVPASRPLPLRETPREGARFVGYVEESLGGPLDGMMAQWAEERLRRAGVRPDALPRDVAATLADPDMVRRFGECLADAVMGVPGARMPMLPEAIRFEFHPYGGIITLHTERRFTDAVALMLDQDDVCDTRRCAVFEAGRLLGRIECRNGAEIDTLTDHVPVDWSSPSERDAFFRQCGEAALGMPAETAGIDVPVSAHLAARAPEASRAMAPAM